MAFLIYKSSAGSGKTTALIKTMLWLSLRTRDPRASRYILAITFTNKAAAELKARFMKDLEFLSTLDTEKHANHHLVKYLINMTSLDTETLQARARSAFEVLLHDYHLLSISTIDAFNHKLIRSFSRDLGLKSDFEVELDVAGLFGEAVDHLLEKVGLDEHITEHLTQYIEQSLGDEKKVNIKRDLEGLRDLVLPDSATSALNYFQKSDHLNFNEIQSSAKAEIGVWKKKVRNWGNEAIDLIQGAGLEVTDFSGGKNGFANIFVKAQKFPKIEFTTKSAQNVLDKGSWFSKAKEGEFRSRFEPISSRLTQILTDLIDFIENDLQEFKLLKSVSNSIHLLAVLSELYASFSEVSTEKNLLPISRFNKIISEALRQEPVGFIYEKYGNRFRHILIDEFQDTSELQWQNILPLVVESLSIGNTNLLVGDAKQSIYRWRGGRAEQFIALPRLTESAEAENPSEPTILEQQAKTYRLNSNYRSGGNIVSFNNSLFEFLGEQILEPNSLYIKEYNEEGVHQHAALKDLGGYVQMLEIDGGASEDDSCAILESQIIQARNAGYDYGDMAILVRQTSSEGRRFADHLLEKGYPVDISENHGIDTSPSVRTLVNLARVIHQPEDEANKLNTLILIDDILRAQKELHYYIEEIENSRSNKVNLGKYFNDSGLPLLSESYREMPISEVLRNLRMDYLRDHDDPAIDELLVLASQKFGNGDSVGKFLEWWDNTEKKPKLQTANSDGITITTIHKSKGLEYPVVFLPELSWKTRPVNHEKKWFKLPQVDGLKLSYAPLSLNKQLTAVGLDEEWQREERENIFDNLNLLYVAFTRASEALFANVPLKKGPRVNLWLSRAMDEFISNPDRNGMTFKENPKENIPRLLEKGELVCSLHRETSEKQTIEASSEIHHWEDRFETEKLFHSKEENIGNYFHKIVQMHFSEQDPKKAMDIWTRRGSITPDEKALLNEMLSDLIKDDWFRSGIYEAKIYSEREFLHEGEFHRPDLILEKEAVSIVIDFKTGAQKSEHHQQVMKYLELISDAFGKETEGYLIYLDPLKRVKVGAQPVQASLF
jgi:ATP-dependent exoDNAse (exonuclease V) beta subunit